MEVRERQIPHDVTYMWNLKPRQMNPQNRVIDTGDKQVLGREGVVERKEIGDGDYPKFQAKE